MSKRKQYRVQGQWLDGREYRSIVFTRKRECEQCLRRAQGVCLIDLASLVIEEVA